MNRLQLAQHGYETIAPAVAAALDEETSDRAERWLHDEVCPVFEELARSRSFRLLVRWSCDRLTAGANSQERRLVEAVDTSIVRNNCCSRRSPTQLMRRTTSLIQQVASQSVDLRERRSNLLPSGPGLIWLLQRIFFTPFAS